MSGAHGPGVDVPQKVAAWLMHARGGNLGAVRARGVSNPEVAAILEDFHNMAERWRASQAKVPREGTIPAPRSEPVRESALTTQQAAQRLRCTTRAITKAIAEDRLLATKVAGRWQIWPADLRSMQSSRLS